MLSPSQAPRNLAQRISDELLPRVSHPGQYVGLEHNARRKDIAAAEISIALCFPDAYSVGISHLGSQVLYHLLNDIPHVACDRAYCPLPDAEQAMRELGLGLFGWESRCHLRDFDVLGFSLSYELCATNVLTMLDLAGVPLHGRDRTWRDPLVIAGDALADTPEPLADFIDVFLAGDGEVPLPPLVELVRQAKLRGPQDRQDLLLRIAREAPAAYVPSLYEPYDVDDAAGLQPVCPVRPDVPATIVHAHLARLSDSPAMRRPLAPVAEAVHDRAVVEIMRGCPNACRFCQAGHTRLPVRLRGVDEVIDIARDAIDSTGYHELSLLSLSTSDYPRLGELIARLDAEFAPRRVSISLPSLRVGTALRDLPAATSTVRKGGLTIAAETASERLRRAIRKEISDQDMLEGVKAAYAAGWSKVKLYFMAGLPGETDADIDGIFELCMRLSRARLDVDGRKGAISASVSWLVPKPHTPMQWWAMREAEYFWSVRHRLRDLTRRSPVTVKLHHIERSLLEALLCRGDRRVGRVIEAAWRAGARLDAWDEHFKHELWQQALKQTGIDPAIYVHRPLPPGRPLPWTHILCPHGQQFLQEEFHRMKQELEKPEP
jgi:radical SAM family uncharacterized protein